MNKTLTVCNGAIVSNCQSVCIVNRVDSDDPLKNYIGFNQSPLELLPVVAYWQPKFMVICLLSSLLYILGSYIPVVKSTVCNLSY